MEIIKKNIQNIIMVVLICIIFTQRSCNSKSTSTIVIPPIKGTFKKITPKEIKPIIKFKDSIVYLDRVKYLDAPVDKELAKEYLKAKDSISKLNLYLSSIQVRKYKQTFSDKNIDITIDAETTGTLDKITPTYVFKHPREIEVAKNTVFAIYTGGSMNLSIPNIKPEFFANIGFQNKRGDIIIGGIGTNKTIQAIYVVRILNIKN
jgi:hypothetical protein